ncbi:MAG TPA: hypothetical protein PKJ56_07765 [Promineifilum sp.]|nr:hypothetical protein [Promineifilum sp.]
MTEPAPIYQIHDNGGAAIEESQRRLSRPATNLARRVMSMERQCNGRGSVSLRVVFTGNGEWVLMIDTPGPVEVLGGS